VEFQLLQKKFKIWFYNTVLLVTFFTLCLIQSYDCLINFPIEPSFSYPSSQIPIHLYGGLVQLIIAKQGLQGALPSNYY